MAETEEEPQVFTDSTGAEQDYPEGLADSGHDEYQRWWEGQVEANAGNHDQPIALQADLGDEHFKAGA